MFLDVWIELPAASSGGGSTIIPANASKYIELTVCTGLIGEGIVYVQSLRPYLRVPQHVWCLANGKLEVDTLPITSVDEG